jgi:hypothetical protein
MVGFVKTVMKFRIQNRWEMSWQAELLLLLQEMLLIHAVSQLRE